MAYLEDPDQSHADVLLTARAECFLFGHHDALREWVRRLQAFAEAGADVLFAPGPHDPTAIKALVDAVRPKPINVLVVRDSGLSVADIAALGVRRISVGGALALAAWTGFTQAAQKLKSEGSFAGFASLVSYPDINGFFVTDYRTRQSDKRRAVVHQPKHLRMQMHFSHCLAFGCLTVFMAVGHLTSR